MNHLIKQIEADYGVRVLYLTKSGSHLYGVNSPTSDLDVKGIFVPTQESVLLKQDIDYITLDTNKSNTKNTADDTDIHLDSIYKWVNLLAKGETGAIDTLFSIFRKDTILFQDTDFTDFLKANYKSLITCKAHAFVGYSIQMQKKYNIRGERFNELIKFKAYLSTLAVPDATRISSISPWITSEIKEYKYINYVEAPAPRGTEGTWKYLEILGRKYAPTVSLNYLIDTVQKLEDGYGSRVKTNADNLDFKSLYHSVRVLNECHELLTTGFITFPSPIASHLLEIKEGKHDLDAIMQNLSSVGNSIDTLEEFALPPEVDKSLQDQLLLSLIKGLPCKSTKSGDVSEMHY